MQQIEDEIYAESLQNTMNELLNKSSVEKGKVDDIMTEIYGHSDLNYSRTVISLYVLFIFGKHHQN